MLPREEEEEIVPQRVAKKIQRSAMPPSPQQERIVTVEKEVVVEKVVEREVIIEREVCMCVCVSARARAHGGVGR